ncbi:guanine deaminase [Trichoderma citrinoviride]|uniref:Probable guanine deaminase n=1 Tax=Trichoderma citrinoviride TaxID=58853 RepID=A0A2T4B3Q2_9HYPO|nr:guanine deaminase [Trichoderma citrinoviride]PTB63965.1 guanine deaminase [Trichoderma citrinoviride]
MSPQRKLLLLGTFVHSKTQQTLDIFHSAGIAVDARGKIAAIERDAPDLGEAKARLLTKLGWDEAEVDVTQAADGQFFFPGFIDTHIHAPQYANAGIFGKSSLLDWLETYTFPLEASLADLAKARRVYARCIRRTLSHGTTTATYFATLDVAATNLLADLCLSMGQRAFVGRVCMDRAETSPAYYRDASAEASLEATRRTIEHVRRIDPGFDVVSPILTPRFAPSCTREVMAGLARIHRETGLPIQTHVSENAGEIQLVARLFPEASSYTDVYRRLGLLTPRTVLAHAVHLSEDEADAIAGQGAKVSHCPCSNTSLTSGAARVRWMWDKGIDVGLGTDVSGGYSPSILEAARQAAMVSRHVAMNIQIPPDDDAAAAEEKTKEKERVKLTVEEVLYLATRGGAKCVGLEDKVGAFEVGMEWDAQLVALSNVNDDGELPDDAAAANDDDGGDDDGFVDVFGWESWGDRVAKWLYNGDDRNTKKVWVKGRLVHRRR